MIGGVAYCNRWF